MVLAGGRSYPGDASQRGQAVLSGYLGQLPHEALEHILGYLGPTEIGLMETTCRYFLESGIIEQVARHNLKSIPRAKGLTPMFLYVDYDCFIRSERGRVYFFCSY